MFKDYIKMKKKLSFQCLFISLLGLDLSQVELQLLAFQHVSVSPAALAGSGGDGCKNTTRSELIQESCFNLALLLPLRILLGGLLGPLLVDDSLLNVRKLGSLLSSQRKSIVRLVPLTERSSVDDHDGALHKSLGSDQLVVASIVDNINDPSLASNSLGTPGKVSSVEPECPVLLVASPDPQSVNPLWGQLGHGGGSSQLKLPLLPDGATLAACSAALMPMVSRDTHTSISCRSESSNISLVVFFLFFLMG